jgi:hypothetical protein
MPALLIRCSAADALAWQAVFAEDEPARRA